MLGPQWGKIISWEQKHDLKPEVADQNIRSLWLQLHADMTTAFPDVLYKLRGRLHPNSKSPSRKLIQTYPDETRSLLEVAIARPDELTSAFLNGWPSMRWETLRFAINTLAEVGAESSVPMLIKLQNDPELGDGVVKAIRMIRLTKPH